MIMTKRGYGFNACKILIICFSVLTALPSPAPAPEFPGFIFGMVVDASRFPTKRIAGATIRINGVESDFISSDGWAGNGKYYSGLVGFYRTSRINAGNYTITAEARGYEVFDRCLIRLLNLNRRQKR